MELHSSLLASLWRETLCAGGVQHVALDIALSRVRREVASWLTWRGSVSLSLCICSLRDAVARRTVLFSVCERAESHGRGPFLSLDKDVSVTHCRI